MRVRSLLLAFVALLGGSCSMVQPRMLVACADPNNLPFSNRAGEGFENKLAQLIAADLHAQLSYVWWAQRRGYVRNTLNEAKCDFWPGIASNVEMVATSRPYYRSTYVFVTRQKDNLTDLTLDDPRLRKLTVGVQMVGSDAMNTPPAHALARRGIIDNVRGYMLYGDYREANPPAAIVRAVARGEVDVALVWGPLAGYFAAKSDVPLRIEPVTPWLDDAQWPMAYDISVGVRKNDTGLLKQIDEMLARRATDVAGILRAYHVPVEHDGQEGAMRAP
ncbi:MAG: substrate-binding domain-containing protein [Sphingomicrobium sp.]